MSIVIEPINVNLVAHDNPLGTVTNTPNFDWHMTNLRNYMTVNPSNVDQSKIELRALGAGNGMWGISGDLNPTSRFVRAALFSAKAVPSANAEEGINQIFQLLNNFDIPKGIARDNNTKPHHSQTKSARDPRNLRFYDKTYDDQAIGMIVMIVMEKFDLNAKEIKSFRADKSSQPGVDMSSMLKQSLILYHCRFGGSGCLLCTRVPLFFNTLRFDLTCYFYCTRQNRALRKSVQNHCRYSASKTHDNAAMQAALALCHRCQREA